MTNGIPHIHREAGLFPDQARGEHFPDERRKWREKELSDLGLADAIRGRLLDEPALDASHVEVTVKDSEIILRGIVPTYRDRHLAETLVDRLSDGAPLHNELRVQERLF